MAASVVPFAALFVLSAASLISPSQSATCTSQIFTRNTLYSFCNDLPTLDSFLHWTYDSAQSALSIVFITPPPSPGGWISWAINPTNTGMRGAQALVAFKDGRDAMTVKAYNILNYSTLDESNVWFQVKNSSAEFSGGVIRLFATLILPVKEVTAVNHVWQVGPSVTNGMPNKHSLQGPNLAATGRLDLLKGQSAAIAGADDKTKKKNVHGILNCVAWGVMIPFGVLFAKYGQMIPAADPAWFYLHASCQVSAYAIGIAGFVTGIKIGYESPGVRDLVHLVFGILLAIFSTIQMSALFLRPKKDHKYRECWKNIHHGCGVAILGLSFFNIFRGLFILRPKTWSYVYIAFIVTLVCVVTSYEITAHIRKKRSNSSQGSFIGG